MNKAQIASLQMLLQLNINAFTASAAAGHLKTVIQFFDSPKLLSTSMMMIIKK
jgi:hypothetical protein